MPQLVKDKYPGLLIEEVLTVKRAIRYMRSTEESNRGSGPIVGTDYYRLAAFRAGGVFTMMVVCEKSIAECAKKELGIG